MSLISSSTKFSLSSITVLSMGGWYRLDLSSLTPVKVVHLFRTPNNDSLDFLGPREVSSSMCSAVAGSMTVVFSATWYSIFRLFLAR